MFIRLLARRKKREPLAYILGEQEFWSRSFFVNPAVLIPRPETEFLLESVFAEVKSERGLVEGAVLDLCCGSGVIAIILALELRLPVVAIDLSAAALQVTRRNCRKHGVEQLVKPVRADLLSALRNECRFSLVVSNPPYVSSPAIANDLEPEVREHEPWLALDGGEQGLDLIQRIRDELPRILAPGGQLFMEIGYDQGAAVTEMFAAHNVGLRDFHQIRILKDYAGRDRVLHARMR
jgi:release factor glutamine methyltransferase